MVDISIVVPVYNEEESLPELAEWIGRVMAANRYSYELIFVNDGSTDSSWEVIRELSRTNGHIKAIGFTRNYGKSAALDIGFAKSNGQVVITMDADLQDSPDEIPALYNMITQQGYDIVSGWKKKRHDPITKTIPSRFFNRFSCLSCGIKEHDVNCGLNAYRRKVVEDVHSYGQMRRYIALIAKWSGFRKIGEKVVEHRPRKYGYTKFGLERFVNVFLDLISVSFVNRYKKNPMHFFGLLGSLSFLTGFGITLWLIFVKLHALTEGLKVRET